MARVKQLVVREVQLAYLLGFADVEPFRRALKAGEIPPPNEYLRGMPVWYVPDLERRYGNRMLGELDVSEGDVLAIIEKA